MTWLWRCFHFRIQLLDRIKVWKLINEIYYIGNLNLYQFGIVLYLQLSHSASIPAAISGWLTVFNLATSFLEPLIYFRIIFGINFRAYLPKVFYIAVNNEFERRLFVNAGGKKNILYILRNNVPPEQRIISVIYICIIYIVTDIMNTVIL